MRSLLILVLLVPLALSRPQPQPQPSLIRGSYIIGGKNVFPPGRWPWQASLQRNGHHICGASLISSHWLVTAAHCVTSSTSSYQVVLGLHDINRKQGDPHDYSVERIIRHPSYTGNGRGYPNDIAVMYLDSDANTDSTFISAITMASTGDSFVGSSCYITGWGKTYSGMPNYLQQAQVGVYSPAQCTDMWGSVIGDYHICVGNYGSQGSCSGDSGGPLVCPKDGGGWLLVGATSWGESSCSPKFPSIYSSVPYFRDWIRSITAV